MMKLVNIAFILCAVINYSFGDQSRIIHGTIARDGEFPFMVSVQTKTGWPVCGGSIIAPKWILTAAHCTAGDPYKVQYGSIKLNPNSRDVVLISQMFAHPSFYQISLKHDLALFKLATAIPFGPKVNAIRLPKQNQKTPYRVSATIMGWSLNTATAASDILQKVSLTTIPIQDCQKFYIEKLVDTDICAGSANGQKGTCVGDSGSPLIINNEQVGILSIGGPKCVVPVNPTLFTDVALYTNYILHVMNTNP